MEHLILILCLAFVFVIVAGLHLYTMNRINNVQKNLMMGGKDWKDLERASAGALYTMCKTSGFSLRI